MVHSLGSCHCLALGTKLVAILLHLVFEASVRETSGLYNYGRLWTQLKLHEDHYLCWLGPIKKILKTESSRSSQRSQGEPRIHHAVCICANDLHTRP